MAGAVSFGDIQPVLDAVIRAAAARWHLHGADADDFAQDVRVAVLQHDQAVLRRFRGEGARTYFFRIAHRVAIDRIRRQRGRGRARHVTDNAALPHTSVAGRRVDPERVEPEIETTALREHVVTGLRRVLAVLSDDERVMLAHRFVSDESANAIARATGGSRRSVARRLAALLSEMRDLLAQVRVSHRDAAQVLAQCRIDPALLDEPSGAAKPAAPCVPDPTRPDPTAERPLG